MSSRRNHSKTKRNAKVRSKSRSKEKNRGRKSHSRLRSLSTSRPRSLSKSRSRSHPRSHVKRWNSPLERTKKLNRRRSPVPKIKRESSRSRSRPRSRSRSKPLTIKRENSRCEKLPRSTLPPNHNRARLLTPLLPSRGVHAQSFVGNRTRLYIGSLLPHINAEHLLYFFGRFGVITDISVQSRPLKGMNFAFVQYAEKKQAGHAIEEMTGASIDGKLITIEYARPKRPNIHGPMGSQGLNGSRGHNSGLHSVPIHNPNFRKSLLMRDKNTANQNYGIDQNPNKYIINRKKQFKRKRPINKNRSRSLPRGRVLRERTNIPRSLSNDRERSKYGKTQIVVRDGKRKVLLRDSKVIGEVNITNERWRPGSSPLPRASHRSRSRSLRRSPARSSHKIFRSHSRPRNGRSRSPRRPLSPLAGTLSQKSSPSQRSHSSRRSRSPLRRRPKSRRSRSCSRSNKGNRLRTRFPSRSRSHSYNDNDNSRQRVQIRNLPPRTIAKDIIRSLSKYGKIVDAWIVQDPQGTAFVEFDSKTTVEKVLRLGESIYMKDNKISIHPVKVYKKKNVVNNRVHIRNLTYDTTSKDVKRALEGFGKITNAWIINDSKTGKSRGVGFVDFELEKDAERAIKSQAVLINNRRAHLHFARPLEEAKYSNTNISKRLEIRNLTYGTASGDLKKAFEIFGHVIDAWIVKNKNNKSTGVGFVEFASSKAFNNAWKQSQIFINNRRVHLHLANQNTNKSNRALMAPRVGFHQKYNRTMIPAHPSFPMNLNGKMMDLGGNLPLGMISMAPTRLVNQHLPSFLPGQSMKPFTNMQFPHQRFIQPELPMSSPMQPNHLLPHPSILRTAQPPPKRRRYT